jgi:hypothetical protein
MLGIILGTEHKTEIRQRNTELIVKLNAEWITLNRNEY